MSSPEAGKRWRVPEWLRIATEKDAVALSAQGVAAAYICAAITGLVWIAAASGLLPDAGYSAWTVIDIAAYAGIGWWISKRSRAAAVLGLLVYVVSRSFSIETLTTGGVIMTLLFVGFFVNGIRGNIAYWRLKSSGGDSPAGV